MIRAESFGECDGEVPSVLLVCLCYLIVVRSVPAKHPQTLIISKVPSHVSGITVANITVETSL